MLLQSLTWYAIDLHARIRYRYMPAHDLGFLFHQIIKGTERGHSVAYDPVTACATGAVLLAGHVFVTSVDWCKATNAPYHEFLVAHVKERRSDGRTPRKSVVWIDRNIPQLGGQKDGSDSASEVESEEMHLKFTVNGRELPPGETPPAPPPKATHRIVLSQPFLGYYWQIRNERSGLDAADVMFFSFDGSSDFIHLSQYPYNVCQTLTIHGEHLSLTQLAVLARTVHYYHLSYELPYYQCYWYAEVIYSTIKRLVEESADNLTSGTPHPYTEEKLSSWWSSAKLGYYRWSRSCRVAVTQGDTIAHETIHERYHQALHQIEKDVAVVEARRQQESRKVNSDQCCKFKC